MRHLDLFSGQCGFALAAGWAWQKEYRNVGFCEIDSFCQNVIRKHYPDAKIFPDIKTLNPAAIGPVDLITAGVPCQPASHAGKRKGEADDRWLWPRTLEIVFALQPRYAILENVPGLLSLQGGMAFEDISSQMEASGYETVPLLIPAGGVGAPHLRYRIWIVAYRHGTGREESGERVATATEYSAAERLHRGTPDSQIPGKRGLAVERQPHEKDENIVGSAALPSDALGVGREEGRSEQPRRQRQPAPLGNHRLDADPERLGHETRGRESVRPQEQKAIRQDCRIADQFDEPWVSAIARLCAVDDGLSGKLVRLPNGTKISGAKWRNEAIKACGNSIVPQVAYEIFKAIKEVDQCP